MINGDLVEFLDLLYFGEELSFVYKGHKYFLQGWTSDKVAYMELIDYTTIPIPKEAELWKTKNLDMRICAKEFLQLKIWGGKTFLEIQKDVEWIDME